MLVRKLGPRNFISAITLFWGATLIVSVPLLVFDLILSSGLIHRRGLGSSKCRPQMVALRLILGILEAGFSPGCVYLLSTWYARCEISVDLESSREIL